MTSKKNVSKVTGYFFRYIALSGVFLAVMIFVLFIIHGLLDLTFDVVLGLWAADILKIRPILYFWLYLSLGIFGVIFLGVRDGVCRYILASIAQKINLNVIQKVLNKNIEWFEEHPTEMIKYRLVEDLTVLDLKIPDLVLAFLNHAAIVLAGFIIICYVYYAVAPILMIILCCWLNCSYKRYTTIVL